MLKNLRNKYVACNIQLILVDKNGIIAESDNNLITLKEGSSIFDLHPFFFSLESLFLSPEKEYTFTCVHLDFLGSDKIYDINVHARVNGNKSLIILNDLSEHYFTYQSLAQTKNESIINEELVTLKNIQLQEREKFKDEFIANFSHEIRNPLTSILSFTHLLQKTQLDSNQQEYLKLINNSNNHLKLLLEDILSINKIESGNLKIHQQIFDLRDTINLLTLTYNIKAKEKGLSFNVEFDEKIPEKVEGDALRINQVLVNLLENAIKFTKKGKIKLNVSMLTKRANKVMVRFEIADTGIGIPEDKTDEIFNRFIQIHENERYKGTGLGLTIVKRLLELMDGNIQVESKEGEGSRFYFDLMLKFPLHSQLKEEEEKERSKSKIKKEIIFPEKKKKYSVLLVDNDQVNQMLILKILSSTKKFFLDIHNSAEGVIEDLMTNEYDLILMDIKLPDIEGHILTQMIRDLPFKEVKKIPVIGLTGSAFPEEIKKYKKAGMNDIIQKPFDEYTLLKKIASRLK
ncbi:ATP-binding response regulator [Abyssalbus ytuae]|uniref:histidine kinase n=1 Tax=Abyssalbus ytuae TaxID=2926907 RepID=A0A9E7CTH2_9FLAO|nr:ATP-binding protein [Abyssalbus ytuae]UOB16167.1 ATP-binding protein [Abyssalbus ytuae]